MAHDLLEEPLLSWRDRQRRRWRTTLPGVLQRLATGELEDFPRLRTHQFHPWCMFLTQLAVLALKRSGATDPRLDEGEWAECLLALTGGRREAWSLVVDDLSTPAFLQPPVPEGSIATWSVCRHPDDLDILVTTRSHDVKTALMRADEPENWIYALAMLQTMEGHHGRGYNRVSRMKGAHGSRPRVGISASQSVSTRFLRDLVVMLEEWPRLVDRGYADGGLALAWLEPWDGQASLPMTALAPHFIEVCWRVRCKQENGDFCTRYTTTKGRRCVPEVDTGDVGDPWIPVERADGGALTVGRSGFNYELFTNLMFEREFAPAAAQKIRPDDGDAVVFVAAALARGQGKTEGLHERVLTLAGKVRPRIGTREGREAVGERAAARVARAALMRSKVLFPTLKQLALDRPPVRDDFTSRVDEIFFEHLFGTLDLSHDDARIAFDRVLLRLAREELERAIARSSFPDARRYKAISAAEAMFAGCLARHFADVVAESKVEGVSA